MCDQNKAVKCGAKGKDKNTKIERPCAENKIR